MTATAETRPQEDAPQKTRKPVAPRYFNREISWMQFNLRVMEEAYNERHPLLERVKFLSIFNSNLDEFFMIRISGLREQVLAGITDTMEDGLTPAEQLRVLRQEIDTMMMRQHSYLCDTLIPELHKNGIILYNYNELTTTQKAKLHDYYLREVYPVLAPLAFDPSHPFPHISNLSLNLWIILRNGDQREHFARLKIPQVLPRLVPVDMADADVPEGAPYRVGYVWLEQLIAANLDDLFPGLTIEQSYVFRVIRDADIEIRDDEASDLLLTMEQTLQQRRFGSVIKLAIEPNLPDRIAALLIKNLEISPEDVYETPGPLGLSDLMELHDVEAPTLKDSRYVAVIPPALRTTTDTFSAIRTQDILLHHPYESFAPVVDFIERATADPGVLAIKQTLYRVGSNSPIVSALKDAARRGKQVTVLVELKARFDEESNIEWAKQLEQVGVHVVYGLIGLKTHCKVALVVRKEGDGIRRYVHLGTGNYNSGTARIYTDFGYFTARPEIGADASILFNMLTGYATKPPFKHLLVSPLSARTGIIERIEREIVRHHESGHGRIIFKMNALVDTAVINAIYKASQAGVKTDLIIRGSCDLVPGVAGLSENVRVISIVGRFLEHARAYYFRNGGDGNEEIYLGSADMMPRNLDRRIETLFPIQDARLRAHLVNDILMPQMKDTTQARILLPDGTYARVLPKEGREAFDSQQWFMAQASREDAPEARLVIRDNLSDDM